MTREEKRKHWQGLVARWQASGMGQGAWCRQESVAAASLRQWAVKLREPQTAKNMAGFVRLEYADRVPPAAALLEVRLGAWSLSLPLATAEGDILKVLKALAAVEAR